MEVSKPRIPVISNVDAKPHSDPAVIKSILTQQVTCVTYVTAIIKSILTPQVAP